MNFFTDIESRVAAVGRLLGEVGEAEDLPVAVDTLDDNAVFTLMQLVAETTQAFEQVALVTSGVIGKRSTRQCGHSGLAQSRGHRTPASLIQHVSGVTRAEAQRQARVGASLIDTVTPSLMPVADTSGAGGGVDIEAGTDAGGPDGAPDASPPAPVPQVPWHAPVSTALMHGEITSAQHDAITRGLGEPPTSEHTSLPVMTEAWSLAATELLTEAPSVTVEDLRAHARAVRDILDPKGAEARFLARYEARSFTMWTDRDGTTHGRFTLDDESAALLRTIIDSAMRPRRGGPRFVDPTEKATASALRDDPRTNPQLTHDLLIDIIKAGATADAETVFGTRQAGIRVVQVIDRDTYLAGVATPVTRLEDTGEVLPQSFTRKQQCETGVIPVIADRAGNPLDVGREQRLFTPKQRIALAVRDGGCRWTGCDRPASYCEAHHIDAWGADKGRTDIDRGVLLCRFHHMQLHHGGWRITREGLGPFLLHAPESKASKVSRSEPSDTHSATSPSQARPPGVPGVVVGITPPKPGAPPNSKEPRDSSDPLEHRDASDPIELRPPLPLTYAWKLASPLKKRFRNVA